MTTPNGINIFYDNPFDPKSGGRLEEDVVPKSVGYYVENIFFPPEGMAPHGFYEYMVRGGGNEPWNVTVALNETVVDARSGVGDEVFRYQFGQVDSNRGQSSIRNFVAVECSPTEFQCCETEDCVSAGPTSQSCSNRYCVTDGMPRFTLKWTGESDMDLWVQTPNGIMVNFMNPFDPLTGGVLEDDSVPFEYGYWVENIYFPNGPDGVYRFGVSGSEQEWELDVYVGKELKEHHVGRGLSLELIFVHYKDSVT